MAFMQKDSEFTRAEVEAILLDVEKYKDCISHEPPVEPTGGDVFLYQSLQGGRCTMDLKFDQKMWKQKGSNLHNIKKYGGRVLKRYYHIRTTQCDKGSAEFRKNVYCLVPQVDCKSATALYLIHYLGNESVDVLKKHGSSKPERVFISSKKEVFAKILHEDDRQAPTKEEHMPVNFPHHLKQVQNATYATRSAQGISHDEMYSIHELAYQLPGFVWYISTFPDLLVFAGMPEMMDLAQDNLEEAVEFKYPQMLGYETTFQMGDFYVSVLTVRNTSLVDDPVFPVGFMLHERELMQHHEMFLHDILGKLRMGEEKFHSVPIAVGREKGIVEALKTRFPNISLVLCRNRVLHDIEYWVKKNGCTRDDIEVLKDQIEELINLRNRDEFEAHYSKFAAMWPKEFIKYFNQHLREDLSNIAFFGTEQFDAFKHNGPTNNISESMHKMLKSQDEWKELPVDAMVLSFYYMQSFFLSEFQRARYGLGSYNLKRGVPVPLTDIDIPSFVPLEDIVGKVKDHLRDEQSREHKNTKLSMFQTSLANTVVKMGLVSLTSSAGVFVVKSPWNETVHVVQNNPDGAECCCPSTGKCCHILAVEMATGMSLHIKRPYNLSQMRKRDRGRAKTQTKGQAELDL
ncbi:uncharacterized protein LOC133489966 [Phyllopteryx taeniolatus]|uniref:uncharacterized protein LOC133489966 n=1 Tax=Phyllopteryx taeniolatus TaxID=161469 RepID=UPI002AD2E7EC|nr:uncharacterized protein LOC133489966 [Phyllopteryx taeniolatus]XP_061655334.1 uncharacterized protein LOC133489966 [Phyllopteryx taeniolatus]XP_061655335.1 uncharacterized protein LOC133489966 [Phyllopteryx taeniolatus]XP_061655336.1 uncharacterized protein LOC133489966 [Phyllopteryx taeniolatus]